MAQTIREIDTKSINKSHKMEVIYARKMFSIQYDGFPINTILNEYPKYNYAMIEEIIRNEGGYIEAGIVHKGVAQLPHNEDIGGSDLNDVKYHQTYKQKGRHISPLEIVGIMYEGRSILTAMQDMRIRKKKYTFKQVVDELASNGFVVGPDGIVRRAE